MKVIREKPRRESKTKLLAWQIAEIKDGIKEADAGEFARKKKMDAFFRKWIRKAR